MLLTAREKYDMIVCRTIFGWGSYLLVCLKFGSLWGPLDILIARDKKRGPLFRGPRVADFYIVKITTMAIRIMYPIMIYPWTPIPISALKLSHACSPFGMQFPQFPGQANIFLPVPAVISLRRCNTSRLYSLEPGFVLSW